MKGVVRMADFAAFVEPVAWVMNRFLTKYPPKTMALLQEILPTRTNLAAWGMVIRFV